MCVALVALGGCSTTPVASVPSPPSTASPLPTLSPPATATPVEPVGGVNITGSVTATYSFEPPPTCKVFSFQGGQELDVSFYENNSWLAITLRAYHGSGVYYVGAPFSGLSDIAYDPGSWWSSGGQIDVVQTDAAITRGTISAAIAQPSYTASADRLSDAIVTGTWACTVPPGS